MRVAAVSDTGPLIHLAEIESLELLSVFDHLCIPQTVYEELQRGGLPDRLASLDFELVEAGPEQATSSLDAGERAAIAVANERDFVLLTDDLAARETAADTGIEVHGSIGVIALAYSRECISKSDATSLMRALQNETSLFVTDAVVERGIRML
ncbi:nucleic acid-binding protein [Halohasta salina]|uniref:nucleic acid-binding protein n=1 Tax=Halohasta salina TaxID=2961621 RepID=UPI0020A36BFF|nr:nucleic acid-binding protein [Halohasta salina]